MDVQTDKMPDYGAALSEERDEALYRQLRPVASMAAFFAISIRAMQIYQCLLQG